MKFKKKHGFDLPPRVGGPMVQENLRAGRPRSVRGKDGRQALSGYKFFKNSARGRQPGGGMSTGWKITERSHFEKT